MRRPRRSPAWRPCGSQSYRVGHPCTQSVTITPRARLALVASLGQWIEGARPRTLPNAIAPVVAGTGGAAWLNAACWWKALLALLVAVAMIIGVNYANDYSDGVRGTDDVRAGPLRLVGSKLAAPRAVLTAAAASLGVAAVSGLVLAWFSAPWL